jgi:hypothetical protein
MKKEFLVILIITLAVGGIWVVSDLVHTKSDANNLPEVKQYLDQVNPTFDQKTMEKVSSISIPIPASSNLPQPSSTASASARPSILPSITPQPSTASASPSASPR